MTERYISPQSGPVDIKTDKDSHYRSQDAQTTKEMVLGTFTPTESEVKTAYQRGEDVSWGMSELRWQRFINQVKAAAWEEGSDAGYAFAIRHPDQIPVNPYESEKTDES
ncbi:hypothetical protein [Bifidobacterium sp.]|jgi:hypothetical protein|uniref:hypothetical protein n=1 Tax=Bifidobacterium sp. TaxID=41200 RepID=UPI0025C45109|nr:hypothetical protein [Bifidobacterium sp.]MCI1635188.1 hypothetical protein [Bifidobacterium sp.]